MTIKPLIISEVQNIMKEKARKRYLLGRDDGVRKIEKKYNGKKIYYFVRDKREYRIFEMPPCFDKIEEWEDWCKTDFLCGSESSEKRICKFCEKEYKKEAKKGNIKECFYYKGDING